MLCCLTLELSGGEAVRLERLVSPPRRACPAKQTNTIAGACQRTRLIASGKALAHRAPCTRQRCTTDTWLDPLLKRAAPIAADKEQDSCRTRPVDTLSQGSRRHQLDRTLAIERESLLSVGEIVLFRDACAEG
jgi:hypothetical protein